MNRSRPLFLRQWPARRVILDNQASEMDCTVPPHWSDDRWPPSGHEPIRQTPRPMRKGLRLVGLTIAAALIGAGVLVFHESEKPSPRVASVLVGMR